MLDETLVEQVIVDFALAGGIEYFFLDLRVDGQLQANLLGQLALGCGSICAFIFFEKILNFTMIGFQQSDRILRHETTPAYMRPRA